MKGWKIRYEYQLAGWIVYNGTSRLRDIFPTAHDATLALLEITRKDGSR